jgi:hypothetical protein
MNGGYVQKPFTGEVPPIELSRRFPPSMRGLSHRDVLEEPPGLPIKSISSGKKCKIARERQNT